MVHHNISRWKCILLICTKVTKFRRFSEIIIYVLVSKLNHQKWVLSMKHNIFFETLLCWTAFSHMNIWFSQHPSHSLVSICPTFPVQIFFFVRLFVFFLDWHFLLIPLTIARCPKTKSLWCHNSSVPSIVTNGPNLAELKNIDQVKNYVFLRIMLILRAQYEFGMVPICNHFCGIFNISQTVYEIMVSPIKSNFNKNWCTERVCW